MNDIDSESVASCWSKIKATKGTDFFVGSFYRLLFEHHPEIRALFPDNMETQKTSLLSMLNSAINGIEYIDDLKKELIDLGNKHKDIGIKKEMYENFIASIITAANLSSDFSLTDRELTAWENTFRKISDIMLKAY